MLNSLRTCLICLMMLAIPTQGIAAAAMVYCGLVYQQDGSASVLHAGHGAATTVSDVSAGRPPQQSAHESHEHASHHTSVADSGEDIAFFSDTDMPDLLPKLTCSVCADCSSSVVIASFARQASSHQASPAPLLWVPASPVSFLTGGPERPPRTFPA